MNKIIILIQEHIFGSYWFLPSIIIIVSIILAWGGAYFDRIIQLPDFLIITGSIESYRTILEVIASSMMTITGIVFSMTLVTLSLASNNFGSRIIRNFIKKKLNQVVLGSYLACFVYCVFTLLREYGDYIPYISVYIAILFALANIFLLIVFIHNISKSIQVEVILQDVYRELLENIRDMKFISRQQSEDNSPTEERIRKELSNYSFSADIWFEDDGYIEVIDIEDLRCLCSEKGFVLWFWKSYGDYITRKSPFIRIYSSKEILEEEIEAIRRHISIGSERIASNDIRYSFWQIIQIAVRALSPGINDPFTAISAVDKLGSAMSEISFREFAPRFLYSEKDTLQMILPKRNFHELLKLTFDQIRFYASTNPQVLAHIMQVYKNLLRLDISDDRKEIIKTEQEFLLKFSKEELDYEKDKENLLRSYRSTELF